MINDNEVYTMLPNQYITGDCKLTTQQQTILTLILLNKGYKDSIPFNINMLLDLLNIKKTSTTTLKSTLNTLKTLEDKNIVSYYTDTTLLNKINILNVNYNKIIYTKLEHEIESYTKIYDIDIYKILDYCKNNKIDKYNLLGIYIYLLSCINTDEKSENYLLCFPSYKKIEFELNITSNTINTYIKELKKLEIIYCDYAGYKEVEKGKIKNTNMYYCRYKDKDILTTKINSIVKEQELIKPTKENKKISNKKRSLKIKLNNLNKKEKLTDEEKELKNKLENEYKKLQKKHKNRS